MRPNFAVRRKPVGKWVERRFSEERLKKIAPYALMRRTPKERLQAKAFRGILKNAEKFLEIKYPENSTIIFIGTSMKPLFEAVRGLNEIRQALPRKGIKYAVISLSYAPGIEERRAREERVRKQFLRKGIPARGKKTFLIVDDRASGTTFGFIANMIKSINPDASVVEINQYNETLGQGIAFASIVARPTIKFPGGRLARSSKEDRMQYLVYQRWLQSYLDGVRGQTAPK